MNAGSGNGDVRKNDIRTPEWSGELKTTSKSQYPLKESELTLAEKYALLDNREMLFGVQMASGRNWITVSEETFLSLYYRAYPDADVEAVLPW